MRALWQQQHSMQKVFQKLKSKNIFKYQLVSLLFHSKEIHGAAQRIKLKGIFMKKKKTQKASI